MKRKEGRIGAGETEVQGHWDGEEVGWAKRPGGGGARGTGLGGEAGGTEAGEPGRGSGSD